jgi:hypothetical protein
MILRNRPFFHSKLGIMIARFNPRAERPRTLRHRLAGARDRRRIPLRRRSVRRGRRQPRRGRWQHDRLRGVHDTHPVVFHRRPAGGFHPVQARHIPPSAQDLSAGSGKALIRRLHIVPASRDKTGGLFAQGAARLNRLGSASNSGLAVALCPRSGDHPRQGEVRQGVGVVVRGERAAGLASSERGSPKSDLL